MTQKVCKQCGSEFEPGPRQRHMKFCGRTCYEAQRKAANPAKCSARYYRNHEANKQKLRDWYHRNREDRIVKMRETWRQTRAISPWRHIMAGAKHRASVAKLPFDLTEEWAATRWTGRCEVSDIPFMLMLANSDKRMFAASIDRIDPKQGYTQDNCRFILFAINCMRQDGTDADMLRIAEAIIVKKPHPKRPL